jgi:ATP-dependent DNA helicase RecG
MPTLNELLIAEATEYEFKSALETGKPKSWLKTVSAFANGQGGSFFYGVEDDGTVIGLAGVKWTSDKISEQIKERISPLPEFSLSAHKVDGEKTVLVLKVPPGEIPPYYYFDGNQSIAFVRVGNSSNPASPQRLSELVMRGKNLTFDSRPTDYKKDDLSFNVFEAVYKKVTKKKLSLKEYISFGMCKPDGTLTFAGLLFADDCPLLQARVFCTRWNGLTKSSVHDDAVDSEEFEGDIISLLQNSHNFVRLNSKVRWKKMPDRRIDKPDYANRAAFEAIANALMHRDWSVVGSEVHVDMYDDRLDVYSPGGMPDGSFIQNLDIEKVPSIRRNPIVADVFHRLKFAERQGSGLRKIVEETSCLYGYTDADVPRFESTPSAFHVILKNMNYLPTTSAGEVGTEVTAEVSTEVKLAPEKLEALVAFCASPRSRREMQDFCEIKSDEYFRKNIVTPMLALGLIRMTIPDKPNSRNQRYVAVDSGKDEW